MYYGEKGMYRWMVPSRAFPLPLLLPSRYLLLATRLTTPAAPARAQGTEALTVNDLTVGWSEPVSEAVSVPSTSWVGDGQLDGRRGRVVLSPAAPNRAFRTKGAAGDRTTAP